jgi:KDO2-lipid IV(A) lauroyltransferase
MKRRFNKLLAYCCFALLWVTSLFPMWVHYIFSDIIYLLLYRVAGYRKATVRRNISTAFPEKSLEEWRQTERQFYHWFCDYLVETIKLMTISEAEMRRRMVFKGTEQIERLWREGVSCGVMLGHYCNWEWISTLPLAMTKQGVCAELYHPIENPDFDRLFLYIRQRFGSVCIPMEETLRHIVKYQREGKPLVIGYIADQKPNWRNIHLWVPFLNHLTPVFTGSERIIKRTRQAFFYGDVRRVRRGYYECEFKLIEEHSEQIEDYQLTERYMQELEKSIRRAPAYWLWTHDRWQRTKEEFDYRFEIVDGKVFERIGEEDYAKHMGWKSYWHH